MNIFQAFRKAAALTENKFDFLKQLAEFGYDELELEFAGYQVRGRFLEPYGYNFLTDYDGYSIPHYGDRETVKKAISYFISLNSLEKKLAEKSEPLREFLLNVQQKRIMMTEDQRWGVIDCICSEFYRRKEPSYLTPR